MRRRCLYPVRRALRKVRHTPRPFVNMHFAFFCIPLIYALQICTVNSRPTSSSILSSLSFPLANITHYFLPTDRVSSNLALGQGRPVNDVYPIPPSDIVLQISRDPNSPVPPDRTMRCLRNVGLTASVNIFHSESVPRIFRHQEPHGGVNFAITNTYASELLWRDVLTISDGLKDYYQGNQLWQEALFYVRSQSRGPLGSGSVSNSR